MIEVNKNLGKTGVTYPKLMQSTKTDVVVLFTKPGKGMVVVSTPRFYMGEYSETWDMDFFANYQGTLTLENK